MTEKANSIIRKKVKESGLKMWQVADLLGMRADSFSVWLRHELPLSEQYHVVAVIGASAIADRCNERKEE